MVSITSGVSGTPWTNNWRLPLPDTGVFDRWSTPPGGTLAPCVVGYHWNYTYMCAQTPCMKVCIHACVYVCVGVCLDVYILKTIKHLLWIPSPPSMYFPTTFLPLPLYYPPPWPQWSPYHSFPLPPLHSTLAPLFSNFSAPIMVPFYIPGFVSYSRWHLKIWSQNYK